MIKVQKTRREGKKKNGRQAFSGRVLLVLVSIAAVGSIGLLALFNKKSVDSGSSNSSTGLFAG
jgi:hypothetical protein